MRKRGFTLMELLLVICVVVILYGIFDGIFGGVIQNITGRGKEQEFNKNFRTDIRLRVAPSNPYEDLDSRAKIFYEVPSRWGFKKLNFEDVIASEEELDRIFCITTEDIGFFIDPNADFSGLDLPSWDVWLERFDEVRKEYSSGLKEGAECFLRAKAEKEKK